MRMTDDLDAQLAQILRRSAALPPLDTTGLTLDEAIAATIRQVVATSPLRLRPPTQTNRKQP